MEVAATSAATLSMWNDGEARDALLEFVRSVVEPGASFVPVAERIATFDNDGTLWCEKPAHVQAQFIIQKWKAMAEADAALAERQPGKPVHISSRTGRHPDFATVFEPAASTRSG